MRRTLSARLLAILVAVLFIGGVGGASDLDALLFHGREAHDAPAAAHVERGGTTHHADDCLLGFRLAGGRAAPPLGSPIRFEGIPQHAAAPRPTAAPQRFLPGLHQDSRAPPASLA